MASFDVVADVDMQEVKNAVDQVSREITQRYDFKGSKSSAELNEKDSLIVLMADDEMKRGQLQEMLSQKLSKRGVTLKAVEFKDVEKVGGDMLKQTVIIKQALSTEEVKRLNKLVKGKKFKVTCSIQGDQLRVDGKKRDTLQEVMGFLKTEASDLPLDFTNFRD